MSSKMLMRVLFAGIAFAGAGVTVGAPQTQVAHSVIVGYSDLNLAHPEGAAALYRRIKAAGRTACGPSPDPRRVNEVRLYQSCYEQAIAEAIAQVDRPALTALARSSASQADAG